MNTIQTSTNQNSTTQNSTIQMKVTERGFEPSEIEARVGEPLTLRIKRVFARTCATSIQAPGLLDKTKLPLGEEVVITVTPTQPGDFRFGCAMGMHIGGTLHVNG